MKKSNFENEKTAKKRTDEITCQNYSKDVTLTNDLIIKLLNDNKEMIMTLVSMNGVVLDYR